MSGGLAFRRAEVRQRSLFGAGVRHELAADELVVDARRILIVTTPRGVTLARELTATVADRVAGVFDGGSEHVSVEVAKAARAEAADVGADLLLAVGGGSPIGVAKAIAMETPLPIVAVPTTYSGSETTDTWGLTEAGTKRTGRSPDVLPRLVAYDPELTATMPAGVAGPSGLNALAHAVEALYGPRAEPVASLLAVEAVRRLARGLPGAVAGDDPDAHAEALYGAYLAGTAYAAAGGGLHHALCHLLGGTYGLPHARTHAVLIPYVTAYVTPGVPGAMAALAEVLDAESAAAGVRALAEAVGAPTSLREIGLPAEAVAEAAARAVDRVPPATPVETSEARLRALLEAAYEGRPPT